MKNETKANNPWLIIAVSVAVVLLLGAFCYFTGYSLVIPLLLAYMGLHLYFIKKASVRMLLNLGLLITLLWVTIFAIMHYTTLPIYIVPVAAIAMLTMLLFNSYQLSFLMSFVSSVLIGLIAGGDFQCMMIYFLGSITGAYSVKGARTRGQLIVAGLFIGGVQVIAMYLMDPVITKYTIMNQVRPLFINGFIGAAVVLSTLKVFESLFGEITNFTLLELSDSSNQPLLKRMVIEAPGTYHHSLIVSNLSEAACDAIGANALLTRVGAYYHDIGKMVKPEYFTENQLLTGNKHDHLEPNMSRLVILNHVKEGIELGKKHKLNQKIIDFIPQHHGTSLVYYFYQKALEGTNDQVDEENYRYPGPKPQTRETATVLLADSVEGATRSLDEHTPQKIDDVVRKVINNKFIDGQLDECDLTLKDIEIISSTFTRVLSAMYHGRIKYPEKKSNGNNNKKSAESNSDSADQDEEGGDERTSS